MIEVKDADFVDDGRENNVDRLRILLRLSRHFLRRLRPSSLLQGGSRLSISASFIVDADPMIDLASPRKAIDVFAIVASHNPDALDVLNKRREREIERNKQGQIGL